MSWMSVLYDTYEAAQALDLPVEKQVMPISHTLQNTHISIVIDGEGNFKRAWVMERTKIILPATENSAGRASGEAPHPLADKLQYVAGDYPDYGGEKKAYFDGYQAQLQAWCDSEFSHAKARAVLAYVSKRRVILDLVEAGILPLDESGKFIYKWEEKENGPTPLIFKVLPKKTGGVVEPGDALVCWEVEKGEDPASRTWEDATLQQAWISYNNTLDSAKGLCFVTGTEEPLAYNHPAKLRHTGDKAKLVSANDLSGFTFRGRFTDTKKTIKKYGSQCVGVSLDVTQKAHNTLRWLISRQGFRNGDQVFVTWAVSGKEIPKPFSNSLEMLSAPIVFTPVDEVEERETGKDYTTDIGQQFASRFSAYLKGYYNTLEPNEQIVVLGIDSATPGRMGIIFYREFLASEFLDRLRLWHTQFAWPQRHTREEKGKKGKPTRRTIWPVSTPAVRVIAEAAYGDILKSHDTLRKKTIERILPCIIDAQALPRDLLDCTVQRACNRNSIEPWEWERNLGIACALHRGFYLRHPDHKKRRTYKMALEESRTSRDYLYGRLLAIAEDIERRALYLAGENRPTTAARMMQRFADRPFSTWRTIELALQPYMQRLRNSRDGGFLTNRKKELDAVHAAFDPETFLRDTPLSGEFLLGYHCQRQLRQDIKADQIEKENMTIKGV